MHKGAEFFKENQKKSSSSCQGIYVKKYEVDFKTFLQEKRGKFLVNNISIDFAGQPILLEFERIKKIKNQKSKSKWSRWINSRADRNGIDKVFRLITQLFVKFLNEEE